MAATRIYLEEGASSVFAVALDWPGWCRRAKTPDLAIEALDDYAPRYAKIVTTGFTAGRFEVVGTLKGDGTTDFGAPNKSGPWDDVELSAKELHRRVSVLSQCWRYFDSVVATAPSALRKGPRGGGRDRDQVAAHVREAERAYARKIGARLPPRTAWPEQRTAICDALREATSGAWPKSYAMTRIAWHVVDHAWEIEDKIE